ncbi:hypothetical protein ACFLZ5_11655, partial [Thermodesulfobacteriota bacterium]
VLLRNVVNGRWHLFLMDGATATPNYNISLSTDLDQVIPYNSGSCVDISGSWDSWYRYISSESWNLIPGYFNFVQNGCDIEGVVEERATQNSIIGSVKGSNYEFTLFWGECLTYNFSGSILNEAYAEGTSDSIDCNGAITESPLTMFEKRTN